MTDPALLAVLTMIAGALFCAAVGLARAPALQAALVRCAAPVCRRPVRRCDL